MQLLPADVWKEMLRCIAHESRRDFILGLALRIKVVRHFRNDIEVGILAKGVFVDFLADEKKHEIKSDSVYNYAAFGSPYL